MRATWQNRTRLSNESTVTPARPNVLQRKCAFGTHTLAGGGCDGCKENQIQTKLVIGQPGDAYEREADRLADFVSNRSEMPAVRASFASVPTTRIQREGQPKQKTNEEVASSGQRLDADTRAFMEPRFGHDFSRVRIHADPQSAASASAVNARAYTVGHDVVFGSGQYSPRTTEGRRLLAHELTHVIQQNRGGGGAPSPAGGSAVEAEADRVSNSLTAEQTSLRVSLGSGRGLARALETKNLSSLSDPELNAEHERVIKWLNDHSTVELDYSPTRDYLEAIENEARRRSSALVGHDISPAPAAAASEATASGRRERTAAAPAPVAETGGFVSGTTTAAPCPPAPCPPAPAKTEVSSSCSVSAPVKGTAPPAKETPTVPALNTARFGGDPVIAKFAKELAECHAARVVQEEVQRRYNSAIEKAKKESTAAAKEESKKTIVDAVIGIDPKDKKAVAAAKKQAAQDAETAARRKIAGAQAAVVRPDVATVQKELALKFEEELAEDFTLTMDAAVRRFRENWLGHMKHALDRQKAKLVKKKNAQPKVKKGETPPPPRPAEEINAEIEAEMVKARCEQDAWIADQIESVKHGWMVGRREQVDFKTIKQNVTELKDFKPARVVPEAERAQIPESLKSDEVMPGVAPEVKDFLVELEKLEPNFRAANYGGHGVGSWKGAGFSLDLYLSGKESGHDDRGFWQHAAAVRFLLHLNDAATAMGAQWRVLYNDFGVAEEVNHATGKRNVTFVGNVVYGGLNWHGPAPMVLHFHLDIQLPPPAEPKVEQPEVQPAEK